jgi:hypothetical protein
MELLSTAGVGIGGWILRISLLMFEKEYFHDLLVEENEKLAMEW